MSKSLGGLLAFGVCFLFLSLGFAFLTGAILFLAEAWVVVR